MMRNTTETKINKRLKVLVFSILYFVLASYAMGDKYGSEQEYIESSIDPLVQNISESQSYRSPSYPTKIMSPFDWAQRKNINTIQEDSALSYSFTVIPGTTLDDLNVALIWRTRFINLDINFGRWDNENNFVSLRQSVSETNRTESIYVPSLLPGTYSIFIKSEADDSVRKRFRTIFDSKSNKSETPFLIKWSATSRKIRALNVRAKLQGPYDNETGLMNDNLRTLDLIPAEEPYFLMGWGGAGEEIDPTDPDGVLAVTGKNAIVDWIKVQLYDYTFEGYGYVDGRSALLQRDGDIVDINGGPVQFWNLPSGNEPYYVAIQHRNHSTIITEFPHPIDANEPVLDFTLATTILSEDSRNPSRNLQNGEWVIWSGDVVRNGAIDEGDSEAALEARGQTGYLFEDVNLDGTCDVDDSNIISENQGRWDWG